MGVSDRKNSSSFNNAMMLLGQMWIMEKDEWSKVCGTVLAAENNYTDIGQLKDPSITVITVVINQLMCGAQMLD